MKATILFLVVLLHTFQAWAQQQNVLGSDSVALSPPGEQIIPDSLIDGKKLFLHPVVRKVLVPSLLIGWGVTHMDDEGLFEGSRGLRDVVQRNYPSFKTTVDNHTAFVPVLMAVGLNVAGVKGKQHFTEQAVLLGMT